MLELLECVPAQKVAHLLRHDVERVALQRQPRECRREVLGRDGRCKLHLSRAEQPGQHVVRVRLVSSQKGVDRHALFTQFLEHALVLVPVLALLPGEAANSLPELGIIAEDALVMQHAADEKALARRKHHMQRVAEAARQWIVGEPVFRQVVVPELRNTELRGWAGHVPKGTP